MQQVTVYMGMGPADMRMVEPVYARTRHEGVMKQLEAVEAINAVL